MRSGHGGTGGEYFDKSVVIDDDVLTKARETADLRRCTVLLSYTESRQFPKYCQSPAGGRF